MNPFIQLKFGTAIENLISQTVSCLYAINCNEYKNTQSILKI